MVTVGDYYYIIFDSLRSIGRVGNRLNYRGTDNILVNDGEETDSQFEVGCLTRTASDSIGPCWPAWLLQVVCQSVSVSQCFTCRCVLPRTHEHSLLVGGYAAETVDA